MKLLTLVLLTGTLFGQVQDISASGNPLALAADHSTVTAKNVSSKEILAYVIDFIPPDQMRFEHDYYFKPAGIAPGETTTIEWPPDQAQPTKLKGAVLYVQFVDGSEWGDPSAGAKLINGRQPLIQLLSRMIDAYGKGGEAAFVALLNSVPQSDPTQSMAQHFLQIRSVSGISGAMFHLNSRVAAAAKHDKTLHP